MTTLYSGPISLFTGKVRIALDEKGVAHDVVTVPFSKARGYEPKHPEVAARNPKRQVPVLVDGDVSLYDSTVINEYLDDRYPEPPLLPRDPVGRARCRQLEHAADEVLFPHVMTLIYEVFYKPDPATRDAAKIDAAHAAVTACYDAQERAMGEEPYLCGAFSVADIGWFMTITFATSLGAGLGPAHPHLQAWYASTSARPSIARELERLLTGSRAA